MENEELVQAIEAMLFASGRSVDIKILSEILGVETEKIKEAAQRLKENLQDRKSGIQLIEINNGYQLATLEKFYSYICTMLDNRSKPNLSQAALEVLAIVAYNPKITRAEMEKIRGVSSDSAMNKLLEYNLIEEAGKLDAPGRPMTYKTTDEFLRLFGYKSLEDMPKLPALQEDDGQTSFIDDESSEKIEKTTTVDESSENA